LLLKKHFLLLSVLKTVVVRIYKSIMLIIHYKCLLMPKMLNSGVYLDRVGIQYKL